MKPGRDTSLPEDKIQYSGSYRNESSIVSKGPEQVLLDSPHGPLAQRYGGHYSHQVTANQGNFARLHGDIGTCTNGDTDICLGQCRSIVNAVPPHCPPLSLFLQFLDLSSLMLRKHFSQDTVNACFSSNSFCRAPVVAGEHGCFNTHPAQRLDRFSGTGLQGISQGNDSGYLATPPQKHYCLTSFEEVSGLLSQPIQGEASLLHQLKVAQEKPLAFHRGLHALPRDGIKIGGWR